MTNIPMNTESLPPGWRWAKLGDVIEFSQSGVWGDDPDDVSDGDTFIVLRSTEIDHRGNIVINPSSVAQRRVNRQTAKNYFLMPNDLLIVRSGGTTGKVILGRVGIYTDEPNKYLFSNFLLRCRVKIDLVNPFFLWFHLNSQEFLETNIPRLMRRTTGIQNLPMDEYFAILIPLPPLAEQKRIAEKLQEIMADIDHARSACKKQLEAAKSLPSVFLRQVFESEQAKSWPRKKLAEICRVFAGSSAPQSKEYFDASGPFFFRVINLGKFGRTNNLTESQDRLSQKALDTCQLVLAHKGTILFPKSGAAIAKNNRAILGVDGYIVSHLMALEPKENVLSDWLYYAVCQIDMMGYSDNIGYPSLKKAVVEKIEIPLPPLDEQKRIASELNHQISEAQKVEQEIEKQLETINALPQTILRKAFCGELVESIRGEL